MMARQYTNMDRLNAVDKTLADIFRQSRLVRFAPAPQCTRTTEGDEISKWLEISQLCHCPDMHTWGTWAASRENFPVFTTLKRSLGKEFNSPGSRTASFRKKLVNKPTQAHPL